jgi:hypothetical protein
VEVERAADLYAQGATLRQIGAELGVPWPAVGYQLPRTGVTMRRGGPPGHPASAEQILELRDRGLTWKSPLLRAYVILRTYSSEAPSQNEGAGRPRDCPAKRSNVSVACHNQPAARDASKASPGANFPDQQSASSRHQVRGSAATPQLDAEGPLSRALPKCGEHDNYDDPDQETRESKVQKRLRGAKDKDLHIDVVAHTCNSSESPADAGSRKVTPVGKTSWPAAWALPHSPVK